MDLAERAGGVVINADASQLYADLRVLTARPSVADEVRVPHRLYGALAGDNAASAARWVAMAKAEIAAAHAAGLLPIVTGGGGLYLRTLLDGIAPVPAIDPALRAAANALTGPQAHAALTSEDPAAAARLSPGDTTRTRRALEVVRSTGRTLADWQRERAGGIGDAVALAAYVVTVPRPILRQRISERVAMMLAGGALDEVRALAAICLPSDVPVMKAIGVPELLGVLRGDTTLAEAEAVITIATRQYAKRQTNWFTHQTPDWTRIAVDECAPAR